MEKKKPATPGAAAPERSDVEQEPGGVPAEPIDTDDNDEPYADASGDFDDEREDENEAVRSTDVRED